MESESIFAFRSLNKVSRVLFVYFKMNFISFRITMFFQGVVVADDWYMSVNAV